jgi:type IV fimbrial biogenesis protein FimT
MNRKGFTLLELIIVVALIGIVATLAAPSFNDSLARMRLKGAVRELASDIRLARSLTSSPVRRLKL